MRNKHTVTDKLYSIKNVIDKREIDNHMNHACGDMKHGGNKKKKKKKKK